jgi:regulator of replication initiation timing
MAVLKFKSDTSGVFEQVNQEQNVTVLEQQVESSRSELRSLLKEIKQMERDVTKFLDYYYSSSMNNSTPTPDYANSNQPNNEYKNILKRIFNNISKICNTNFNSDAAERVVIDSVCKDQESYDTSSLDEFARVEEYLIGKDSETEYSPKKKLEDLSKEYDSLMAKVKNLKLVSKPALSDPENEIKKRLLWAKVCGEDLISNIKIDLSNKFQFLFKKNG